MMQIKKLDGQWYRCYYSMRNGKLQYKKKLLIPNYVEGQSLHRKDKGIRRGSNCRTSK